MSSNDRAVTLLEEFRRILQIQKRDSDEDVVLEVMDRLVGFVSPRQVIRLESSSVRLITQECCVCDARWCAHAGPHVYCTSHRWCRIDDPNTDHPRGHRYADGTYRDGTAALQDAAESGG